MFTFLNYARKYFNAAPAAGRSARVPFFLTVALLGLFWVVPADVFAQANRADVKRFRALRERAVELAKAGKVSAGLPYFEKMVQLQPYNETALYLLSLALLHRPNIPRDRYRRGLRRAVALLKTCVKMQKRYRERSPALGLRYFYLGMAYWYSGDSMRALTAFRSSYRADFQRVDAVYNEYALLEELGLRVQADLVRRRYLKLLKTLDVDD